MKGKRKLILSLAVIFTLNILIITTVQERQRAQAAAYRQGATGAVVTQIQKNLIAWGYMPGRPDGIFGPKTAEAVRYFQRKNGLAVDGIVGPKTLAALGINDRSATAAGAAGQNNDVALLARLISAEARGEPYNGQVAVGAVVLNRVKHPSFPNTLSGVIYQSGAFSCLTDGQFNQPVADSAVRAARDAINGSDPSGGAIYYFNPGTATNAWIRSRPAIVTIGRHRFCA